MCQDGPVEHSFVKAATLPIEKIEATTFARVPLLYGADWTSTERRTSRFQ